MYKALIIEDEKPAAEHLQRVIKQNTENIDIIGIISSVEDALTWFDNNQMPDLIFLDIQLSDGLSFEIFNHVKVTCPVIFTTAYQEYALKAFKVNSVDYLLKPIGNEDLRFALDKFTSLNEQLSDRDNHAFRLKVDQVMKLLTEKHKTRFMVNAGLHIRSVEVEKINIFYSLEKSTFLLDNGGKSYDLDYSLDEIENLIDPQQFFRISRKHIVNINAIADIIAYSGNRMKLKVTNSKDDDLLVSRSRLKEFRAWLER
jgi:DNA-binding LytR/AlgR family response regulator